MTACVTKGTTMNEGSNSIRRVYRVGEFATTFRICRTKVFGLIKAGSLKALKVGKTTLITTEAAEEWLASLPIRKAS